MEATKKKIEAVIGELYVRTFTELLEKHGMPYYSQVPGVKGRGPSGMQDADDLSGAFTNTYFIVFCENEQFENIRHDLKSFIKKAGGVVCVSDVDFLIQ